MRSLWFFILFLHLLLIGIAGQDASSSTETSDQPPNTDPSDPTSGRVTTDKPSREAPNYKLKAPNDDDKGPLEGLYKMTRGLVDAVGPQNTSVIDKYIVFRNSKKEFKYPEDAVEIMKVEAGFMACFVIGIILFFGLGLSGCFFCLCRCCCGKCGGKRVQRPKENLNAKRKTYSCLLFITIVFMAVSLAFTYLTSATIHDSIPKTEGKIYDILDDGGIYFNTTAQKLHFLVSDKLTDTTDEILSTLKGINVQVGSKIQEFAEKKIMSDLNPLATDVDIEKDELEMRFEDLKAKFEAMKSKYNELETDLKTSKDKLKEIKTDCTATTSKPECARIDQDNVEVKTDGDIQNSTLPDFPKDIPKFTDEIEKAVNKTKDMPQKALDNTKEQRKDIEEKIVDFRNSMSNGSFNNELNKLSETTVDLGILKKDVLKLFKNLNKYDEYRLYGFSGLAGLLTIPVALIFLGMLCGMGGHRKTRHPAQRGGLSNCGGCSVITGVYLLFFLSGIPVLITIVLFQLGGHAKSIACDTLYEDDFHSIDKIYKVVMNEQSNDNSSFLKKIVPSQTFKECQKHSAIYKAFKLDEMVNLTSELDFEKKLDLDNILNGLSLNVTEQKDLFPEIDKNLNELDNFTESETIANVTKQLNTTFISMEEMDSWILNLNTLNGNLKLPELAAEIAEIEILKTNLINSETEAQNISKDLQQFEKAMEKIKGLRKDFPTTMGRVVTDIETKADKLKDEFIQTIFKIGHEYVDLVLEEVDVIGDCHQLWVVFDVARHTACYDFLDPFNAYWFSLGWYLAFSIFAIAFGAKLAKHYFRMSDMKGDKRDDAQGSRELLSRNSKVGPQGRSEDINYAFREERFQGQDPPPYGYHDGYRGRQDNDDRMNGWSKY